MAKERKSKTFTYKHAVFHESGPKLSSVLRSALDTLGTIGARREPLAPEGESPIWRLIGEYQAEEDFVFCVLMRYANGVNPAFVVDDEKAERLTVEQLAAPATSEGKRRELVEAMLFFGAIDNHLVMMQSLSLRSDHLEKHLQWLLHQARTIDGTNSLQLLDQPPKAVREKLARGEVKGLDIGGVLTPAAPTKQTVPTETEGETTQKGPHVVQTVKEQSVSERVGEGGEGIIDAIKRLMAPDAAAKLDFEKMAGANIEYTLKITYKKSTTEDGQKLMNSLGSALRHAEGVDTKIKLRGGGEIKGEELRLSGVVRIDTNNGIPASSEVFEEIRKWFIEKLKSGEIETSLPG